MYLPDIWDALDFLALEPPAHILLRNVAKFFGHQFSDPKKIREAKQQRQRVEHRKEPKKPHDPYVGFEKVTDASSMGALMVPGLFAKDGGKLPDFIRKAPSFSKMMERMTGQVKKG